jgi:hypothetical protein
MDTRISTSGQCRPPTIGIHLAFRWRVIGSDFFDASRDSMAIGLEDVTRYPYLFAELLRRGYSEDDLLKIAGQNHLRAMRQMEKVAAELQKSQPPLVTEGPTRRHGYL